MSIPESGAIPDSMETDGQFGESVSILKHIGNTPLIQLKRLVPENQRIKIFAKAEWFNPAGSVKDRAGYSIVRNAIRRGDLQPGKVLLDSSSGNTGIAYAFLGPILQFSVKLVVPENISPERRQILQAYGTELIYSDALEGTEGARRKAAELAENNPDWYFADQYSNPDNPLAHYMTTGWEILESTRGKVTHFLATVGTGGTITGTTRRLKEFNSAIQCIGVQPDDEMHGLEGMKYMRGCKAAVPSNFQESLLDDLYDIKTEEAYGFVKRLSKEEGLFVGLSSGAAMAGVLRLAEQLDEGIIVTVFCDSGGKYLSMNLWTDEQEEYSI